MGRQVMQLFQSAAKERGAAVLVVTHDQRALDLVDRIFEIEDGVLSVGPEVVFRGKSSDVVIRDD